MPWRGGSLQVSLVTPKLSNIQRLANYISAIGNGMYETTHLSIRRSTLSYDPTIPPRIVMNVNYNVRSSSQSRLDEVVILLEKGSIECSGRLVVSDEVLPAYWESDAARIVRFAEGRKQERKDALVCTLGDKVSDLIGSWAVGCALLRQYGEK